MASKNEDGRLLIDEKGMKCNPLLEEKKDDPDQKPKQAKKETDPYEIHRYLMNENKNKNLLGFTTLLNELEEKGEKMKGLTKCIDTDDELWGNLEQKIDSIKPNESYPLVIAFQLCHVGGERLIEHIINEYAPEKIKAFNTEITDSSVEIPTNRQVLGQIFLYYKAHKLWRSESQQHKEKILEAIQMYPVSARKDLRGNLPLNGSLSSIDSGEYGALNYVKDLAEIFKDEVEEGLYHLLAREVGNIDAIKHLHKKCCEKKAKKWQGWQERGYERGFSEYKAVWVNLNPLYFLLLSHAPRRILLGLDGGDDDFDSKPENEWQFELFSSFYEFYNDNLKDCTRTIKKNGTIVEKYSYNYFQFALIYEAAPKIIMRLFNEYAKKMPIEQLYLPKMTDFYGGDVVIKSTGYSLSTRARDIVYGPDSDRDYIHYGRQDDESGSSNYVQSDSMKHFLNHASLLHAILLRRDRFESDKIDILNGAIQLFSNHEDGDGIYPIELAGMMGWDQKIREKIWGNQLLILLFLNGEQNNGFGNTVSYLYIFTGH